jgi:hypothetical protein
VPVPRNISEALAAHLGCGATTVCFILKFVPTVGSASPVVALTNLDDDVPYDDGEPEGLLTYRAEAGFNLFDLATSTDETVDNTEVHCLAAALQSTGLTADGVYHGDYDDASFRLYLVNYMDLTMGHVVMQTGRVGEITVVNKLGVVVELRSLTQVLQQKSIIELTSITDRARYGDERNKMPLYWYNSAVATVDSEEPDRTFNFGDASHSFLNVEQFTADGVTDSFQLKDENGNDVTSGFTVDLVTGNNISLAYTVSGTGLVTLSIAPAAGVIVKASATLYVTGVEGYFVPGVVHWLTGPNAGRENEIEGFTVAAGVSTVVLTIPTRVPISVGDTFKFRRDSDKSKARAIQDNNLPNFRGEPELPRGDGIDLQAPTPGG